MSPVSDPVGAARANSLYNDQTWTDADGITWALEDMTHSHRKNLLALLIRRAKRLLQAEAWALCSYDGGEMASMDAHAAGFDLLGRDAVEWLNEQPLVIRLRALIHAEESRV